MITAKKEYGVHTDTDVVNKICVNKFDKFTAAVTYALSSVKQAHIVLRHKQGVAQRMICSSTMDAKHSFAILFSTDSSFPNRLSSTIDLLVVASEGLSQYICSPCNKKFLAAGVEYMLVL